MAAIPVDDTEAVEVVSSEHGGFGSATKFLLTYVGTGTVYFGTTEDEATEADGLPLAAGLYLNDDDMRSQQSLWARVSSGGAGEIRLLRRGPQ